MDWGSPTSTSSTPGLSPFLNLPVLVCPQSPSRSPYKSSTETMERTRRTTRKVTLSYSLSSSSDFRDIRTVRRETGFHPSKRIFECKRIWTSLLSSQREVDGPGKEWWSTANVVRNLTSMSVFRELLSPLESSRGLMSTPLTQVLFRFLKNSIGPVNRRNRY